MAHASLSDTGIRKRLNGMVVCSQDDVDAAFADMEHYLSAGRPVSVSAPGCCVCCGGNKFIYSGSTSGHPGSHVCDICGVVESGNVYWETMYGRVFATRTSNYKRIHHWHERISQLMLSESLIPDAEMLQIGKMLLDGKKQSICKESIRAVLRPLKKQVYIEKWLQIIYRITGVRPPCPGPLIVRQLDLLFQELQEPFEHLKSTGRKNFLNYNYVFCRLFQKLHCSQFAMFFPLIKSKAKLKALDNTWAALCEHLNWEFTPLEQQEPFVVQMKEPGVLLQRLSARCEVAEQTETDTEPLKRVFQMWDRRSANIQRRLQERPRSDQPEPKFQKLGLLRKRPR